MMDTELVKADEMSLEQLEKSLMAGSDITTENQDETPKPDEKESGADDANKDGEAEKPDEKPDESAEGAKDGSDQAETTELDKKFVELGLDKHYKNVEEFAKSVPEMFRYMGELEQRAARLDQLNEAVLARLKRFEDGPAKPEAKPFDKEHFLTRFEEDPAAALAEIGFVRKDDLKQYDEKLSTVEQDRKAAEVFTAIDAIPELKNVVEIARRESDPAKIGQILSRPGVNPYWDAMRAELASNPGLKALPLNQAVPILFKMVKGNVKPTAAPVIPKVNEKDKAKADSSGGGKKPVPGGKLTLEQIDKMSVEELERYGKTGKL